MGAISVFCTFTAGRLNLTNLQYSPLAFMKCLLALIFIFSASGSWGQANEIYHLAFSDASNFEFTNKLGHKKPQKLYIVDTTIAWSPHRFNKNGFSDNETPGSGTRPNDSLYLFKDSLLNLLLSETVIKELGEQSLKLKSGKIRLKGDNYTTTSRVKNIKGFYFAATKPIVSTDKRYAFIDIVAFYRMNSYQENEDACFGKACIVFQKQEDNTWKKLTLINNITL